MDSTFTKCIRLTYGRAAGKESMKWVVLLVLVLVAHLSKAQNVSVSGMVLDENGLGLPGAAVQEKGTTNGVVTGLDGDYTIAVQEGATLVFSFLGYKPQEITVGNQTSIDVELEPDMGSLDEVVVVGYGTLRQEAVTGSVASIDGDQMREVASANVTQALQGRLPGVDISQTSTQPGATMQIRIRGNRSLTASNDPLIVLNGIPFAGSIGDINPEDIESIDVLKDASATAIYGSRGANGVILITTKKGTKGQVAKVSYNGFYGPKAVFAKYPMMNGPEFIAMREAAGLYTNGADESNDVNTDWQDLFYQTGVMTSHDVNVTGGGERSTYSFGVGYYHDEGVVPTQQYDRFSLRASVDQEIGRYFRIGFNSNSNYNERQGSQVGLYNTLSMSPIASPYEDDGTPRRTINMPLDESWVMTKDVLNNVQDQWLNETRAYATYNALYGEFKIPGVDGLKYRMNVGLDYRQSNQGEYTGKGINSANPETPSTAAVGNSHTYHWIVENLLTYDKTFADKHIVNVTALYSAEQNKYYRSRMSARDIPSDQFQFYNLGYANGEIQVNPGDQQYQLWGLKSVMGRVMYSYDDRYMISATLRSDGSSRLAPGHKWHTYPAISAGWNIGDESFMSGVPFVNMLKLRAGYGQTSNQAIAPYATLGGLGTRPYNYGNDTYATGYFVNALPNPNLGWEYSETLNLGLDFRLFNHRLSGTVEYYVTNTKDILLGVNLPGTAGVSSYTANIGETQNKGVEVSLNGTIIESNDWTWEAGVNLYANRNELVSLASGQKRDEGNWWFVGHPINVIYDYEYQGLWQEGDPYRDVLEPGGNLGMIKVKYTGGYEEDGTPSRAIGPDDRQILDLQPNFMGGFNTRVAYKNFDLSLVGAFKSGGILISTLHSSTGYLNMLSGRRNNVQVDYWTPDNTGARYPAPGGLASGDNPKYGNTLGYFDASYLKIRTMTLGYNFNRESNWMDKAGISRFRMYASVQNPFVLFSPFHKESGMDPETNSYGDENAAITNNYPNRLLTIGTNSPATRNFIIGLNLTF
ncbi:SusC/RagA family TonB-linked outer membrane protein [Echinicola vietnamensis]|uniref:TonB-linked outer membrane protein, SusC/RagA family n=1 Tax=Echinicola vietnamensis (strain DSM 17526 / LMG 23754 / KMM 6221) TaxID=926556 RepID=L0FZE9_ECHVK|nr:TonB-dependent receptor [Echinicola vietnamensis]AGA78121.1 TonB-linked outer membrane protein, SusC/RagA family [Echinicola vietnamensis DSM 17526]